MWHSCAVEHLLPSRFKHAQDVAQNCVPGGGAAPCHSSAGDGSQHIRLSPDTHRATRRAAPSPLSLVTLGQIHVMPRGHVHGAARGCTAASQTSAQSSAWHDGHEVDHAVFVAVACTSDAITLTHSLTIMLQRGAP